MKLALFHPELGTPGGAEILLASHAQFFRDAGHDTRLFTFKYDADAWAGWFDRIEVTSPEPDRIGDKVRDFFFTKLARRTAWITAQAEAGRAIIAYNYPASAALGRSNADVRRIWHCCEPPRDLHLFATNPALTARARATLGFAREDATRMFVRKAIDWHAENVRYASSRRQRAVDLAAVPAYPEIWALSEFSRDCVARVYGRSDAEVVYPMVRFPERGPQRSGKRAGPLSVLCHTRLETLKNVDTVLRGFARFVKTREGAGARLHVVGQGPARPRLELLTKKLGLASSVKFHGYLPLAELENVYASCDVFALLPIDEPFGMVFPEAAARGLLVVGPDHGGPLEILDHGRYGWSVSAFDPDALSEALRAITRLPDADVDRRREEADRVFRERFSRATIGRRLEQLLAVGS